MRLAQRKDDGAAVCSSRSCPTRRILADVGVQTTESSFRKRPVGTIDDVDAHHLELERLKNYYESRLTQYNGLEIRYNAARKHQESLIKQLKMLENVVTDLEVNRDELQRQIEEERKCSLELKARLEAKTIRNLKTVGVGSFEVEERRDFRREMKNANVECNFRPTSSDGVNGFREAFQIFKNRLSDLNDACHRLYRDQTPESVRQNSSVDSLAKCTRTVKENEEVIEKLLSKAFEVFQSLNHGLLFLNSEIENVTKEKHILKEEKSAFEAKLAIFKEAEQRHGCHCLPSTFADGLNELEQLTARAANTFEATRQTLHQRNVQRKAEYDKALSSHCVAVDELCETIRNELAVVDELGETHPLNSIVYETPLDISGANIRHSTPIERDDRPENSLYSSLSEQSGYISECSEDEENFISEVNSSLDVRESDLRCGKGSVVQLINTRVLKRSELSSSVFNCATKTPARLK